MNQKKLSYLGLFAAVAIIFGYVESLIPFFAGIPGMKLGLANLAVLFILEKYTWKEAVLVSVVRIIVIGFMFGNLFSILYSLAGAALSLAVYDFHEKKIRIQHPRHQCCRRCFPQHRSAHHRRSYHDDFRTDLLCTGTFDLRCHYRTSHRNADKRGTETYPLLNNTKNAEY